MLMDIYLEVSVIGGRPANLTIAKYVNLAAISWAPIQNHKPVTALSAETPVEYDVATATSHTFDCDGDPFIWRNAAILVQRHLAERHGSS